jgi:hypothetical protein
MAANYLEVENGQTLTAEQLQRSGCSVVVVVPPSDGSPAVSFASIRLPAARVANRELSIVVRSGFGFEVVGFGREDINGRQDYASSRGVKLVPLISEDGGTDGWGAV